jgi:hypothetical protein
MDHSHNSTAISKYLMTAHGTFLAHNGSNLLIQLPYSQITLERLLKIEQTDTGVSLRSPELQTYQAGDCAEGVFLHKDGKYLCALPDSTNLVTDRDARQAWETFIPIAPDDLSAAGNAVERLIHSRNSPEVEMDIFCQVVERLTQEHRPVKLYCGSGTSPKTGFLNLDVIMVSWSFYIKHPQELFIFPFADRRWPLPDNCVDYIFHEDFIEHLSQLQQIQFLAEALRVMKPGSWHRVNTPNLITAMMHFSDFRQGFTGVYTGETTKWGHISLLTPLALKELSDLVGYREVVFTQRSQGLSCFAEPDSRPGPDRDWLEANIFADLLK